MLKKTSKASAQKLIFKSGKQGPKDRMKETYKRLKALSDNLKIERKM